MSLKIFHVRAKICYFRSKKRKTAPKLLFWIAYRYPYFSAPSKRNRPLDQCWAPATMTLLILESLSGKLFDRILIFPLEGLIDRAVDSFDIGLNFGNDTIFFL